MPDRAEPSIHGTHAGQSLAGNIGARILERFTVTFDYADKRVYLKPNKNYGTPMNYDRAGTSLKKTGHDFHVVGVMQGGPAAQAGIQTGDIITAVNGKPASELADVTVWEMLRNEARGTRVKLTLGKNAAAHDVTITLRRLIPKVGGLHR